MKRWVYTFLVAALACGAAFGSGQSGTFVKEFQGVSVFEMESVSIDATILAKGSALKVEAFEIPSGMRVTLEQSGTTLRLRVETDLIHGLSTSKTRLVITVPLKTECRLNSASGDISAADLSSPITEINTASGDIDCAGIIGALKVGSSSGSVTLEACNFGKVIKTASGDISIRGSEDDAVIETASGEVEIDSCQGSYKINTASGDVSFGSFSGRLAVDTASGSISGSSIKISGDSRIASISGEINLDLENTAKDFSFKAETLSGSVRYFDTSIKGTIITGGGSIPLTLKTVSGSIKVK